MEVEEEEPMEEEEEPIDEQLPWTMAACGGGTPYTTINQTITDHYEERDNPDDSNCRPSSICGSDIGQTALTTEEWDNERTAGLNGAIVDGKIASTPQTTIN